MKQLSAFKREEMSRWKRGLRKVIRQLEKALNCPQINELEKELSRFLAPEAYLFFAFLKKKIEGKEKIGAFWKARRKKGLTGLKLSVADMVIEPRAKTEIRNNRRLSFDARGLVVGKYSYVLKRGKMRPLDPGGSFFLEMRHQDDCSWDLERGFFI